MSIMTTIVLPSLGIRSDVYNDNNCITFIWNSFYNDVYRMTTIVLPSFGIRSDVYNDNNCITFIGNCITTISFGIRSDVYNLLPSWQQWQQLYYLH